MSDTSFKLKFPDGEFTHTELAKLNNKTNQQVWTRYQQAIKDGVILSAGERKSAGKGKPSRLWKLNPNPPVVVAAPAPTASPAAVDATAPVPATPPVDNPVQTEPIVTAAVAPATPPQEAEVKTEPASITASVETPAVENTPAEATAPAVVVEESQAPSVDQAITVPVVEVNAQQASGEDLSDAHQIDETCPGCKSKLWAMKDASGVMVWCSPVVGQEDNCPFVSEAPAGHGKTVASAYAVLMAKFGPKVERAEPVSA